VATEKKRKQADPCENKDEYQKGFKCTSSLNVTKYNLHGFTWYDKRLLDLISFFFPP